MTEINSVRLKEVQARIRDGDDVAKEELIRIVYPRLELLARKMLRDYPSVRRWEDTADVLQQSLLRLLRALRETEVATTREFFALAATVIRRELIDLARHYRGPHGLGHHHRSGFHNGPQDGPADSSEEDLARWAALHEAVEKLPAEEREVFTLTFYHSWTQGQIAEVFGVTDRTVRRWLFSAVNLLQQQVGQLPDLG